MASVKSPLPPLVRRDQSITERLFEGLAYQPDRPALIDGPSGAMVTARALRDRIERLAGGLQRRGVGPGVVVAIFAPNMPDYAVVFHGAAYAGATITTVNPSYTAHELALQLADSGANWLFTLTALMPIVQEAAQGLGLTVVEMEDGLEALMGPRLAAQVPVDLDRDVLALPYSSGTTGMPKGVRLSHRNLVSNVEQVLAGLEVRPGEMSIAFLPFFHIYGMNVLMNLFLSGGAGLVTMRALIFRPF